MANGAVLLKWRDRNWAEHGHYIYRSTTPMDINNLPSPIDTLLPNKFEYIDYDVIADQKYYYRIGAYRNNDVSVSDEIEVFASPNQWDIFNDGSVEASYLFDGNVEDESSRYNGIWVGSPSYINGSSIDFDGSSYVELPPLNHFIGRVYDFSISFFTNDQTVAFQLGGDTGSFHFLQYQSGSNFYDFIGISSLTTSDIKFNQVNMGTYVVSGNHTTLVHQKNDNTITVYRNGVQTHTIAFDRSQSIAFTNSSFVGRSGGSFANGTLEHLILFNKALSPSEASELFLIYDNTN